MVDMEICNNRLTVMPKRTAAPVATAIRLDLEPEELEALSKAVDMYNAYLRSQQRGSALYEQLADRLREANL